MSSIEGRLRRLEGQGGRCPECGLPPDGHGRPVAMYDEDREKGFQGDPDERCEHCGRSLYTMIRVVYGEEGEG